MPVRFIHCADIHLGASFSVLPRHDADARRAHQRETFARIVDLALEQPDRADIVFISGDLFDSDRPSPREVSFVRNQLKRLTEEGVKSFIIPGNHDPYRSNSFWCKASLPCTRLFTQTDIECVEVNGMRICVCGIAPDLSNPSRNQLATLEPTLTGDIAVLLHHASWLNFGADTADFHPFAAENIDASPFNYVALGHYHAFRRVDSRIPAVYPGATEALGFSKNDLGDRCVVVGTIDERGNVTYKQHKINKISHICEEIDCTADTPGSLRKKVEKLVSPEIYLRLTLTGRPSAEVVAASENLVEEFSQYVAWLEVESSFNNVGDVPVDNIYLNKFVEKMKARIEEAPDDQKPLLNKALEIGVRAFMKNG